MYERENDTAQISFQWVVGDLKAHEKNIGQLIKSDYTYFITIVSRLIAFALTYVVADALLPNAEFFVLLWIVLAASFSIWVSVGIEIFYMRTLERVQADDPRKVGWNGIWLDSHGIVWSTETTEDYTSWLGVSDIIEQDGSLWIRTGPAHGHFIPPRVFASAEELADCMDLISKLRANPLPPRHLENSTEDLVRH